jgi:hypothetical protein
MLGCTTAFSLGSVSVITILISIGVLSFLFGAIFLTFQLLMSFVQIFVDIILGIIGLLP